MEAAWKAQLEALGEFIRAQRKLANLSLREMAALTNLSNAYLSQVERGLHEPSVRVLKAIAKALNLSADTLLAQTGLLEKGGEPGQAWVAGLTEAAIRADPALSESQKEALLHVYRSYVAERSRLPPGVVRLGERPRFTEPLPAINRGIKPVRNHLHHAGCPRGPTPFDPLRNAAL